MAEWTQLVSTTIRDYLKCIEQQLLEQQRIFNILHTPEEREAMARQYEAEQKRLAAIEAAKTPKQRLREKQDACHHDFTSIDSGEYICHICKLVVSEEFYKAYELGKEHADCDCY